MPSQSSLNRRQLLALSAAAAAITPGIAAQVSGEAGPDTGPEAAVSPDLSGKSILVTGSSSGFGRLGVEYYARLGAKVFATMRNIPRPEADELRDLASSDNLDLSVIEIDVTSDDQVEAGVSQALVANEGKLDVLINNAGISVGGPIEIQDMAATEQTFNTNVYGCHRMARAALPSMRANGSGQIFNISSQLGRLVIPGFGMYSATKFALEAMSEQMAYELVPHGVDVTIIQPGGYPTNIWANNNANSGPLKERTSEELLAAYPALTAGMGERTGGGSTDPMDIPRAIAEIIAMPAGTRPLRKAVHPIARPQEGINEASAQTQVAMLGESPFGPWVKGVLQR
ncbi:MAG: SDR family oxidoreductase [Pseudomonadota bacterium]